MFGNVSPMNIYLAKDGAQTGPFSEDQLHQMLAGGQAVSSDLAWREGMADWQPLRNLLGLSQPPPLPAVHTNPWPTQAVPAPVEGPKGVGGWLVFFCVSLTILSPLVVLSQTASTWAQLAPVIDSYPALTRAILFESIGTGALAVYGIIVGIMIWSGSLKGRKMAKTFLLIRLVAFIAIEGITVAMISDLPTQMLEGAISGAVTSVFQVLIYTAVWWSYFKKSVRVKNTYGEE